MTKHFCDLCGNPAMEFWPRLRVDFPESTWRGCKTEPGSISVTEGSWTPHIDARIIFEACEFERSSRPHNPDLCGACVAALLIKMAESANPRATPEQAASGFQKMREAAK